MDHTRSRYPSALAAGPARNFMLNVFTQTDFIFQVNRTVLSPWAQFGGGLGGRVAPTFSDGRDIICHVPSAFLSLGFAFGEIS